MVYVARIIEDRVAEGDNYFTMSEAPDGRIILTPSPTRVDKVGTAINKELLQPMEDNIVYLMNTVFNDITANPFHIDFSDLDGLTVTGIWNKSMLRVEC